MTAPTLADIIRTHSDQHGPCTCEISLCTFMCELCAHLPSGVDCPGPSSVNLLDLLGDE